MVRDLVYMRVILAWALASALDLVGMLFEGYINLLYDLFHLILFISSSTLTSPISCAHDCQQNRTHHDSFTHLPLLAPTLLYLCSGCPLHT
jgi:hypothetical protein